MADITDISGPFAFSVSIPPIAAFTTIVQRTDLSYLVDAKFNLSKDGGGHQYGAFKYGAQKYGPDDQLFDSNLVNADYSTDGGASWNACSAQAVDFRHTAVNPMRINATPQEFDFVWNAFWDLPDDFESDVILRFEFDGGGAVTVTITSSPFAVSTAVSVTSASLVTDRRQAFKIDDYLGEGPIAPWRRGPSDWMTARGRELVKSAIHQILNSRASTDRWGGELAWDPSFGSLFWTLKHSPGDEITRELAAGFAERALGIEPRVIIQGSEVDYVEKEGGKMMNIRVTYSLINADEPDNQVVQPLFDDVVIEVAV